MDDLSQALLSLGDDLLQVDPQGLVVFAGATATALFGATSLIGRDVHALLPDLERTEGEVRGVAVGEGGRRRPIVLTIRPLAGGGFVARLRAVTVEGEVELRAALDRVPLAIGFVRDGAILWVNQRFLSMYGYDSPERLIGTRMLDHWAERSRGEVSRFAREARAPFQAELTGFTLRSDGTELPVRVAVTHVDLPDGPATIGLFSDMTEQRLAEEALRKSEAFFRAVLEKSPEIVTVIEPGGSYRYVSPGARPLLGYTEEDAVGTTAFAFVHPDDRARVRESYEQLRRSPESSVRVRYRIRRKDGVYRHFEAVAYNLVDNPDVGGIVGNARDVTEQVKLEEEFLQAQKLESIGRLAGGVAHDFNNVLTIILSSTELLEDAFRSETPPLREDVQEIAAAARRASELTHQLLAVARKQVIAPVPLDLNQLVHGSERMLRRLLGEDIALGLVLDAQPCPITADPGQIHQILLNLAVNARDAMPQGGRLTLETERADRGGEGWVRLIVRDTGLGMSAEVLSHVFEPFFTTKPVGRGTGLGLATVHGIVAQCRGHIRVDSEEGKGARFEILFPRTSAAPLADAPAVSRRSAGDETILLVEDDIPVRDVALRALERAGFHVFIASDGQEALELYERIAPLHLLVTDVIMPRLDGARLAEALRKKQPDLEVLFTSGYTDDRIAMHGVIDEDVDLLPKPYTPSSLTARVRAALDRRARARVTS